MPDGPDRPAALFRPATGARAYDAIAASAPLSVRSLAWDGFAVVQQRPCTTETEVAVPPFHDLAAFIATRTGPFWTDLRLSPGRHVLRTGELCVLPQGQESRWVVPAGGIEVVHFYLSPELAGRLLAEELRGGRLEPVPALGRPDLALGRMAEACLAEMDGEAPVMPLMVQSFALAFAAQMLRAHSGAGAAEANRHHLAPWRLRRVRDLVEANLAEGLDLAVLAEASGLSVSRFARAFKRSTGHSPYQYVLDRRVERAKDLLAGDLPLVEVALACGFASQQQFTTMFRDRAGVPPGRWRLLRR